MNANPTKRTFEEIINERIKETLRVFIYSDFPPIMSASPYIPFSALEKSKNGVFEVSENGSVRRFISNVNPHHSFTMVLPDFPGYKNEYINFIISQYCKELSDFEIPPGYDVDHLLAVSNAPSSNWLRLEAIPLRSNRSHGGGAERENSRSKITSARKEEQHRPSNMTWLVAAKLAGILSPLSPKSKDANIRIDAIINYFVSNGFNEAHVRAGLKMNRHQIQTLISEH